MKLLKKAVITAFATATPLASVAFISPTVATASDVNIDGVCTSLEGANTRLFIENRTLLSHDQGGISQSQSFASDPLPAGTYAINGISYDDTHSDHLDPRQVNEQWSVNLYGVSGEVVYSSPVTNDVPEDTDRIAVDFGEVEITEDVVQIEYVHAFGPEADAGVLPEDFIFNSVVPACLAFTDTQTVVEGETTISNQVCTLSGLFDESDPAKLTLTAEHENAPEGAVVSYQVDWGDDSEIEVFTTEQDIVHSYTDAGTYDVRLTVLADGQEIAVCDDPSNTVTQDNITVVLDATTDGGASDQAVLAATGVSPAAAAAIGVGLVGAVTAIFRKETAFSTK